MKTPKMIRPRMMLGLVAIVVALMSYMSLPEWRSNPLNLGILLVVTGLGIAAVVMDLRALNKEYRELQEKQRQPKE